MFFEKYVPIFYESVQFYFLMLISSIPFQNNLIQPDFRENYEKILL